MGGSGDGTGPVAYLLLEALIVFAVVLGTHAARRRTSLVFSFAVLAFMRVGSWIATHDAMVSIGRLELNIGSNVFFTATLLGVFLLYVADGRFAGRAAVVVVVGTGLLYTLLSVILHAQFPAFPDSIFPASGVRASLGSTAASLLDLVLLGMVWESVQRGRLARVPLSARVFATLAAVFIADGLVYVAVARAGGAGFVPELGGLLLSRALVAVVLTPVVSAYLAFEVRRYGLRLDPRPMLSIVFSEDAERELVAARHQLRIGTEALWESEERYRRMVEDIPLMVFRFSSDGCLTYANRALCAYYGRDVSELLGVSVLTPVDPDEREPLWAKVMALRPDAPTVEITAHATPTQGPLARQRRTHRWVLRGIFSPGGERIAFQAIGKDVTREVELEAKVVDSERMQAIGQLAGGIAHDFNNLIFVIWSCVEIASARLAGSAADGVADVADNLLIIRQAADRAAVLTRQLAAVGRNEALRVSAVDLSVLLQNLAPLLKRLLPGTIALDLRCTAGLPAVLVDPAQIERVVINLVTNARDAMPSGGRLVVRTGAETVAADDTTAHPPIRAGRYAVLAVTDTGVGMDAATARRIFEPFFTTKREGRGTGLGLTTAYGIVEQAGGRIRVETAPGAGSTFFVYLPEATNVAVAPARRAPEPAPGLGPILYCEGEDSVRAQVTQLLENAGYRVTLARDAAQALASLDGAAPSLLLVDLVTGSLSGPELAAAIRRRHPGLPAVFFSGSADPDTTDLQRRFWYVNKRHGLQGLLTAVSEATRQPAPATGEPAPSP
ncbi:MAG TPA: ATP-binding protein [Polyangia bacterium]|nr:ATP-binding protein [Polyangia bacterium]